MNYLVSQDESNELKSLFMKINQNSYELIEESSTFKKILFNYYCGKIYDESTKLYNLYEKEEKFEEDLFIEQSNMYCNVETIRKP